jgi:signal transduction histidine kinase/Mg-chelatase subunit ChlD
VDQRLEVLVPASFRADHRAHVAGYDAAPWRGAMRGGAELFGCKKDGTEFPAELTLSPFSDGLRRYAIAAIRDVSERKALERKSHLLLKAQEALKERNAFLSTAAHELRTPVAALQLRLDVLHREAARAEAPLPQVHLKNMDQLDRLTRRITLVVNSVIDVAAMRGGALEVRLEEVDLADAARRVLARLQSDISSSGSEVTLEAPTPVVGRWDPARVDQVLTNLLANALKFGEGKRVVVAVDGDEHRARLAVTDHGIGIAPEDHERIFGRFETAETAKVVPGLGLGLYICGEIVDAHGGTIAVQSTPGSGSTFFRQKLKHGADEITDIELGADLGRLLPSELVKLTHRTRRALLLKDLLERQVTQYALRGNAPLGKGPLVVVLDKSGSMDGPRDIWATALALALLDEARRTRRVYALIGFDYAVKHECVVNPGESLPEEALFTACAGGTEISVALHRGLHLIQQHPWALKTADVVLVTDGGSDTAGAPALRERAQDFGVTILGLGIGVEREWLQPWCDEVQAITDLTNINIDETSATKLFAT